MILKSRRKLDAIGEQGKIALGGFMLFLIVWGLLDFFKVTPSDFTKFIQTVAMTLWSIVLFVIDIRNKPTTTDLPMPDKVETTQQPSKDTQ
jgi:hypothetical protein